MELSSIDAHQELYMSTYPVDTRQGFYIVLAPEDFQSTSTGSTTVLSLAHLVHWEQCIVSIG